MPQNKIPDEQSCQNRGFQLRDRLNWAVNLSRSTERATENNYRYKVEI